MPPGEFDKFLEVGMLALARPEEPDRSRYAQVRHRDLLDRRYFEMGGKCQTYPGGDESKRPVILVGLIHNPRLYAASGKQVSHVLVKIAPRPHDERFAVKIGELHALPPRVAMVFWNSQQVRLFKKDPAREFQVVAADNCEPVSSSCSARNSTNRSQLPSTISMATWTLARRKELSSLETHPLESDCRTLS